MYPECTPLTASAIDNITLTEDELFCVVRCLDKRKANGPDNIPAIFLNECFSELSDSLCAIFNMSLASGYIPLD